MHLVTLSSPFPCRSACRDGPIPRAFAKFHALCGRQAGRWLARRRPTRYTSFSDCTYRLRGCRQLDAIAVEGHGASDALTPAS